MTSNLKRATVWLAELAGWLTFVDGRIVNSFVFPHLKDRVVALGPAQSLVLTKEFFFLDEDAKGKPWLIACALALISVVSLMLLLETDFPTTVLTLPDAYESLGTVGKAVAVVLLIMSMWSLGVGIERFFTYQQARIQSKRYAPQVAKHLREGRLKDAVALSTSKNYRYSHLAKVVLAGLQEYQFQQESGGQISREDLIETVRRSIRSASDLTASDLKRRVSWLATIGSTAPFVGLLGTAVGVVNAFIGVSNSGSSGIGAVSVGISEALVETALGLVVAILAVTLYNYLTRRLEYFNVEMDNSSSELVKYLATR